MCPVVCRSHEIEVCSNLQVCTTGSLLVDFNLDEKPRIINWYFHIKDHTEYIPRTIIGQLGVCVCVCYIAGGYQLVLPHQGSY